MTFLHFFKKNWEYVAFSVLAIVVLYFLLPFLLPLLGVDSYVIQTRSMVHIDQDVFEKHWKERGITPSLGGGINPMDVIITFNTDNVKVGDVVMYKVPGDKVSTTHRFYDENETHFYQYGDRYLIEDVLAGGKEQHGAWVPLKFIQGKVGFVFPRAGLVHFAYRCWTGSKHYCHYGKDYTDKNYEIPN